MATINFKGKEIVRNHHLTIPYHELVPDAKKGLSNPSTKLGAGKRRLVFAPAKYLDQEHLKRYNIDFAQLPFEIYQKQ